MDDPTLTRRGPAPVVDLAFVRARRREPDARMVIEIWRLGDGRIAYDAFVEEHVPEGAAPTLSMGWIRRSFRWAMLEYSKLWRMGLRRRRSP